MNPSKNTMKYFAVIEGGITQFGEFKCQEDAQEFLENAPNLADDYAYMFNEMEARAWRSFLITELN